MEPSKMGTYRTCVDPAIGILKHLFNERRRHVDDWDDDPIQTAMLLEFRFLKMFFWGLDHWQVSQEYDWLLRFDTNTVGRKLKQTVEEFQGNLTSWRQHFDQLKERIKPLKRQVKEICILLLRGELRCKPCQQDLKLFLEYGRETAFFIKFVLLNLEALKFEYHLIALVKKQICLITGKLRVLREFANPFSHSITGVKSLGELISQTRTWANHLSCLVCLYWIDGLDESLASTVGTMLADLMQETMSCTPGGS